MVVIVYARIIPVLFTLMLTINLFVVFGASFHLLKFRYLSFRPSILVMSALILITGWTYLTGRALLIDTSEVLALLMLTYVLGIALGVVMYRVMYYAPVVKEQDE